MKKSFLGISILLFSYFWSVGQNKKVPRVVSAAIESNTTPFSKGKVMLNDGRTEEGQLQYNALEEILIVQLETESKTYYPGKIAGFSFWHDAVGQERTFVTLPWENPANNLKQPTFFEILREFNAFSFLSTRHVMDADATRMHLNPIPTGGGIPIGTKTKIKYQETICFFDEAGNLEPYMSIVDTEKDGVITDDFSSSRKKADTDLVKKYTGIHYEKLRMYAKENHLNFKRKEDLLTILDYYGTLAIP